MYFGRLSAAEFLVVQNPKQARAKIFSPEKSNTIFSERVHSTAKSKFQKVPMIILGVQAMVPAWR
jgi:hypothetical protein